MITEVINLNKEDIKNKIYTIRGQKVMLDFHLAEIYGYTTKAFNQQVQRNIDKFDDDFRFQLTMNEYDCLRSQIVTSKIGAENRGGRRYIPYAFTESGIYMLMTVLKGDLAVKQSKMLIRLFKEMKDFIIENNYVTYNDFYKLSSNVSDDIERIENKIDNDLVSKKELNIIIEELTDIKIPKEYLILNGKKVEGVLAYKEIYSLAKKSIYIIDNYISLKTLVLLKDISKNVEIIIFSDNIGNGLSEIEYLDFSREYQLNIKFIKTDDLYHDRYIVIDYQTKGEMIYHSGPSSKDVGKRIATIVTVSDNRIYHSLIDDLFKNKDLILK